MARLTKAHSATFCDRQRYQTTHEVVQLLKRE
jgi:hypothetical protein